jgi:hypothetical protein
MRVKKIGQWQETRVGTGYDHGVYVEAVDMSRDRPRYAQVAYAFIADDDIRALDRGEVVDLLDLVPEDLALRIDS